MESNEELELVFMPALSVLLMRAEELKSAPLSQAEVERIRDGAICMSVRTSVARQMDESRGYDDLDPEDCWAQWQILRANLADEPDIEKLP